MVSILNAVGMSSTSIKVSWNLPLYPNAEITGYTVYYRKISGNTAVIDPDEVTQDPSNVMTSGYSPMSVNMTEILIEGLDVYRYYSIIVQAVGEDSGTELNGTLREVVERTFSDFPTEPPQIIEPGGSAENTITITLPNHDYINSGEVV